MLDWVIFQVLTTLVRGVPNCDDQSSKSYDCQAHLGGFFMGLLVSTTLYPVVSSSKRHKAITWALRLAAIPVAVVLMVLLIRNFYTGDPYSGEDSPPAAVGTIDDKDVQLAVVADISLVFLRRQIITAKGGGFFGVLSLD